MNQMKSQSHLMSFGMRVGRLMMKFMTWAGASWRSHLTRPRM